jgi:hypothetical protein
MPTTTPPWAPEPTVRLLRVPRRWPHTTGWLVAVTVLFTILCWAEAAR